MAQASRESSFDPSAKAATSSASGLYQFVEQTWLGEFQQHGAEYGYGQLARQILRRIESDYADPDLSPEAVAAEVGISKRYLQTLLAGSGTSFVQELNATRLDRASDLLSDARAGGLSVAEIAFRSGFLDAGYFTRLFRKRFGITPREWRAGHAPQS